jgi:hypothetical protein
MEMKKKWTVPVLKKSEQRGFRWNINGAKIPPIAIDPATTEEVASFSTKDKHKSFDCFVNKKKFTREELEKIMRKENSTLLEERKKLENERKKLESEQTERKDLDSAIERLSYSFCNIKDNSPENLRFHATKAIRETVRMVFGALCEKESCRLPHANELRGRDLATNIVAGAILESLTYIVNEMQRYNLVMEATVLTGALFENIKSLHRVWNINGAKIPPIAIDPATTEEVASFSTKDKHKSFDCFVKLI